jgi:hypothetical protein
LGSILAILRAMSVPADDNLFGFFHRCKALSQLHHILAHRIFNDFFLLNSAQLPNFVFHKFFGTLDRRLTYVAVGASVQQHVGR